MYKEIKSASNHGKGDTYTFTKKLNIELSSPGTLRQIQGGVSSSNDHIVEDIQDNESSGEPETGDPD
ncbi:unnamed protein product [Cochlearia groenlandica]